KQLAMKASTIGRSQLADDFGASNRRPAERMVAVNHFREDTPALGIRLALRIEDLRDSAMLLAGKRLGRKIRLGQAFEEKIQANLSIRRQHLDGSARGAEAENASNVLDHLRDLRAGVLLCSFIEKPPGQSGDAVFFFGFQQSNVSHLGTCDDDR